MIKYFIFPMVLGLFIGLFCAWFEFEAPVRILYTISDNFLSLLLFIAPFIIFTYGITGTIEIRDGVKNFFIRFISLIILTLSLIGFISLILSNLFLSFSLLEIKEVESITLDPYFRLTLTPLFSISTALLMGILIGLYVKADSITIKLAHEFEDWIGVFAKKFLLPFMPFWILGIFAKTVYVNQTAEIFINEVIMSIFVVCIHISWLLIMYFISTKYANKNFKSAVGAGIKLYTKVISIMGVGTGIIVPFAIEAQEEININSGIAKIVSASALNMPGSVISNVVFSTGIIIMFDIDVSTIQLITYVFALVFATMIAPSVPGGVFSVTSGLLTPILGFSPDQISLMGAFYYRQGTTNSATNNAADIYIGAFLDKKEG